MFHSFRGSDYWGDGVLRAVSGADGSRVWPTADPGYRTTPGGEVAIADVDPSWPGPEVLACSASDRSVEPRQPGHLLMIAADGQLLRRFDTAPNDVPCGFDAPMVGDMDGDGTPEIVVRFVIAHADGTVVRRVRDLRGASWPYMTLADVDGDGDLEIVGSDAAYDYDGAPVWERIGELPGGGWLAVADLDLDGGPEVVIVGGGHFIRAVDGATGADVWGPIDINPPELAATVTADGRAVGGGPPTIANFDEDPNPEIAFAGVLMENDYARALTCPAEANGHGIHVLQHPRGQWVRTRRIFDQHSYHVTNIEEDGTVPTRERPNWTVPNLNNFRQNVQPEGLFDAPDAVLADLSATLAGCPSAIGLSVRVVNRGAAGMPAGVPVTFYRDEGGARTLVGRGATSRSLLPGESEVVVADPPFAVPAGMEGDPFAFVAVVNDPSDMPLDGFNQCRTENDTAEGLEASCPVVE